MACQAIRCWTLSKLIGAYLDLAIAYVLLCCSTAAYFVSNFLGFFGFSLPCPCNGVISKSNPDHCLQKLLVDCPADKISAVQLSVRSRLPFDSVWGRNEDCQLSFKVVRENKLENGVIELEGEASCSLVSAATSNIDHLWRNEGVSVAEEGKVDVKGKGVVRGRRQRGNLWRRRKSSIDHAKCNSNSSYDDVRSGAQIVPLSNYSNTGKESAQNSTAVDSHVVIEPSHVMELDHKSWLSSESNGVVEITRSVDEDVDPLGNQRTETGKHLENDGHLEKAVKILEEALKEERAARAALFYDLEKERTAAATATDEAMAMISRLQEEKAAIELEARQYERILEEKSTYDAEEMDILKEIIVTREMEKHFLEKEVESYRKMVQGKKQLEEDACYDLDIHAETLLFSSDNEMLVLHQQLETIETEEKSVVLIGEVKNDTETESNEQYGENLDVQEQLIHDIHAIDDICTSHNKDNAESSMKVTDIPSSLPPLRSSGYKSKASELRRHSISSVDHERQKLNNEVGLLREKLRHIQTDRQKLNLTFEHRDKGETELLMLEDIGNLLQEIRQLTEPQNSMRRISLPPSKDTSKKRRYRSVTDHYQSS